MPEYATFAPSSGQRVSPASGPNAHVTTGSFKDQWFGQWDPSGSNLDPHEDSYHLDFSGDDSNSLDSGPVESDVDFGARYVAAAPTDRAVNGAAMLHLRLGKPRDHVADRNQ
jgi:hypothetical protein